MQRRPSQFQFQLNGLVGLVMIIGFFIALFFIAKGIFTVLSWAAPVLLIAALALNYQTVLGFLRYLWDLLRRSPLMGILAVILTIVGFPIVSGYLFGKAVLDRRIRQYQGEVKRRREGELIDYELVPDDDAEVLDLESLPPGDQKKNQYDDFFDSTEDKRK